MNIQISAAEYKTGAEVIAAAKARRFKMFGPEKRVNWKPGDPIRKLIIVGPAPIIEFSDIEETSAAFIESPVLPEWMVQEIRFDAHIRDYFRWPVFIPGRPVKTYIRLRCEDLGVTHEEISVPNRKKHLVYAKHLIWWEIKEFVKPSMSYPEIGRCFGGMDHTSIMHGVRKMAEAKAKEKFEQEGNGMTEIPKAIWAKVQATVSKMSDRPFKFEVANAMARAVMDERERCIRLVEDMAKGEGSDFGLVAQIREGEDAV
jgi:hypothetical protein